MSCGRLVEEVYTHKTMKQSNSIFFCEIHTHQHEFAIFVFFNVFAVVSMNKVIKIHITIQDTNSSLKYHNKMKAGEPQC